ncbi:MAG: hypothetical protein ACNS61_01330 [Candidatus Wenzhouxiangella sp. M2_3B_020]
MTARSRAIAAGLLMFFVAGCGSIPLGTMWKMARMGPEALFEADPEQVRVAVMSESWALDAENFDWGALSFELDLAEAADREYSFILHDVSSREALRLDDPPAAQRWRVYRVRPEDLERFQRMQRELPEVLQSVNGEGNSFSIAVSFLGKRDPEEWLAKDWVPSTDGFDPLEDERLSQREIRYRVDLQLTEDDGFFPLIRESTIKAAWLGIEKSDGE